jgi:hypothetical protein
MLVNGHYTIQVFSLTVKLTQTMLSQLLVMMLQEIGKSRTHGEQVGEKEDSLD